MDLDGSEFVDLSGQAGALAPPTTSTVLVTLRTTSHNDAMTLLSASNPGDPAKWPGRVGLSRYAAVMGEVVAQESAVFVDHYNHWLDDNGGQVPLSLLAEGLHPDERGHLHLALKMIKDLRIFDMNSRVCSLSIP